MNTRTAFGCGALFTSQSVLLVEFCVSTSVKWTSLRVSEGK